MSENFKMLAYRKECHFAFYVDLSYCFHVFLVLYIQWVRIFSIYMNLHVNLNIYRTVPKVNMKVDRLVNLATNNHYKDLNKNEFEFESLLFQTYDMLSCYILT